MCLLSIRNDNATQGTMFLSNENNANLMSASIIAKKIECETGQ
jgi:hypothetical protein